MKKSTKIIAGITAAVLTLGIAGCSEKTTYPIFINNPDLIGDDQSGERYVINVTSEGGYPLDGVSVAVSKDGQLVKKAVSSNGRINLTVPLGEYTLEVDPDTLPAGYYLTETTYKTNKDKRDAVDIKIASRLIGTNESGCTYSVGGIMKDFTFTDFNGAKHTLSDLLKTRKAVVLNFWYTECSPCRSEFPAMQAAYAGRNDIEVLAICSTHQGDTNADVSAFADSYNLTMPMGVDNVGLINAFGVRNFPTTYVIDRYGLIAIKHEGSLPSTPAWTSIFNTYVDPEYKQSISGNSTTNPGGSSGTDREKPTYEMPASADLKAAVLATGENMDVMLTAEKDDEYSWPWLTGSDSKGSYIYSSNSEKGSSYSIIYAEFTMEKDQVISFDYLIDAETSDKLYITLDGIILNGEGWTATDGWQTSNIYVADRKKKVSLSFTYLKDSLDPAEYNGEDVVKIANLHLAGKDSITEPMDVLRTCAIGEIGPDLKYESYTPTYKGSDGIYRVGSELQGDNGAILYAALTTLTPWNDAHSGNRTVTATQDYYNTLYNLTYFQYAETATETTSFKVMLDGKDHSEAVITHFTIQNAMPGPYYLIPVTEDLKDWMKAFVKEYEKDKGSTAHSDEWLEFCFYYDHYGAAHEDGKCGVHTDPTRGLTFNNAYTAYEKGDPQLAASEKYNKDTGRNVATIDFAFNNNNGTYYKFTAKQAGVYQVRSYTTYTDGVGEDGKPIVKSCAKAGARPDLVVYSADHRYMGSAGWVRDFDNKTHAESYEGFNYYLTLKEGETVYLHLQDAPNTTGYYDFEITYKGTSYQTMYTASTGAGQWSSESNSYSGDLYLAVNVTFDRETNRYYRADRNGNCIWEQPIYISMVHESFMYSEVHDSEFKSVEWLIDEGIFDEMMPSDALADKGIDDLGAEIRKYLDKAKAMDKNDPLYGLVEADETLVEIINCFIDENIFGGRGKGNGWLMFGCYMEYFGN